MMPQLQAFAPFQELREGVYQVRPMGDVLGEVVSSSRLDAFLAQLRGNAILLG